VLIFYLLGSSIALVFPFIYIFFPFQWQHSQFLATYEFALFYLSLFSLFYFWGRDQKLKIIYLVLAGFFLSLTVMSRETFMMFLPLFFIYLVFHKKKLEILSVFIPLALMLLVFWAPSFLSQENSNLYLFKTGASEELKSPAYHLYGHLYADPYTYHFAKGDADQELEQQITNTDSDFATVLGRLKVGANIGERSIGFGERLLVGSNIFLKHMSRFLAIEAIGGPLITLLMLLGLYKLKYISKELFQFFIFWMIGVLFLLSYLGLSTRNRLIDFGWVIALLVSLGLSSIFLLLKDYFKLKRFLWPIYIIVVLLVVYNLVIASHVFWGRAYDDKDNLAAIYIGEQIKQSEVADDEIIATSFREGHVLFNYLAEKSFVYFSPETTDRLIAEGELQSAFDKFGVKYIVGFHEDQSVKILEQTSVINISSAPAEDELVKPTDVYTNEMWFLNLVK
jgi:hypothetical protein